MKIPLWQLQAMIAIARRSGANDDWLIDFASDAAGQGFLLTAPEPREPSRARRCEFCANPSGTAP